MFLPQKRGVQGNFGGDEYIYYLDCCSGFTGVCIYIQSHHIIYFKYVQFSVLSIYLNIAVLFFFKDCFSFAIA